MSRRACILLFLAIGLVGCSGDPAPVTTTEPAEPVIAIGPPAEAPESSPDATGSTAIDQADRPPTAHARTDGRPAWWIDQPQTASGRLYLAVEALGADVRSARRAAVDQGIESLARMLGHDPEDDRIHATTVRPLPYKGGANEGMRYIGYVLVSSEAPGAG
ncbi:MAG: hypothetical protein H6814_08645 [Phycisphaeraceae bacterium]|nr:hypothetical protein [Phycisphaeraceae bacterium]